MKKISIVIMAIIIIVAVVGVKYISYENAQSLIKQENKEFEQYQGKELNGLDVATVINKATDKNTKNNISKDEKGNFIQNDENSIEVEIYMSDNDITYKMESIFNAGTEQFVQYYSNINFKCSKIEYHKKTGRIKYILFEQQTS